MSKRILSLVLALVMVLGTFGTVFAAKPAAITSEKEAGSFLREVKILRGDDKGDLNLDLKLERRDMIILLSRLLGESEIASKFPVTKDSPSWTDVRTDAYYVPFYAWAQVNKIFNGNTDKELAPRAAMTAQDYAVVLLRVLGYDATGHDAWKTALADVKKLGILENLVVEDGTFITRGQMSLMTYNALGVLVKDSTKTLAETLGIKMPEAPEAKDLTAKVNDTENLKEIVVELSNAKLADQDKLQDAQNYKVDGFVVKAAKLDGDNVILLLDKALVKGRTYDLTIRNIDKVVNTKYSFKAVDNTLPAVEKVTVLGEYGIKVTTSEPIKDAKERNFLIDGRNVSMKVEEYGRDIILTPYYKAAFANNAQTLTIKELEDFAGYKSVAQDFEIKIDKDTVAPKVEDMISRGNVVEVTFDKDVYDGSIGAYDGRTDLGNISYQEGRQTIYAKDAEKIDINKVRYTFEKELPRRTVLTLDGVTNHSKVAMDRITQEPRLVLDYSEPEIIKKTVKITSASTATITLKFDKNIEGNLLSEGDLKQGFRVDNHFKLYERDVYRGQESDHNIISAKYEEDSKGNIIKDTVVVKLERLKEYKLNTNDLNYVLEVENFVDATSLRNKMYRDYVDFKVIVSSGFFVKDVKVDKTYSNTTEIKIELSKAVDKVIAEEHTNYLFTPKSGTIKDVRDLKGEVYAERDGKVITIILQNDMFKIEDFKELRILNTLKDINGNRLDETVDYVFGPAGGLIESDARAAKRVSDQIDKLPAADKVVLADKTAINEANVAYIALGTDRQALVSSEMKTKLTNVLAKLAKLEADAGQDAVVKNVRDMVAALPTVANVDLKDQEDVKAARAAYKALSDPQKLELELEGLKLTALENKIADKVNTLIIALPAKDDVTLANEAAVVAAKTAYNTLTQEQKALVTLTKLTDAEDKIVELKNTDKASVNTELAKVGDVELVEGTALTADNSNLVKESVLTKVDATKVTVTVSKVTDSVYKVVLTSKQVSSNIAEKVINVTVAQ